MGKDKNSAALFEVMSRARADNRRVTTGTPSWFKDRSAGSPDADGGATPGLHLDHDRQMISLRTTFTSGIIAVFAILVLVGIAFLLGRHLGSKPASASDAVAPDDPARYNPAMDLTGSSPAPAPPPAPRSAIVPLSPGPTSALPHPSPAPGPAPAAPVRGSEASSAAELPPQADGPRQPGLNYVIIQSYPADMEKAANELRDALGKRGVLCTIEPPPPGWGLPSSWRSVIGTAGFAKLNTPQYEHYRRVIDAVGRQMTGPKFRKPDPHAYKWK